MVSGENETDETGDVKKVDDETIQKILDDMKMEDDTDDVVGSDVDEDIGLEADEETVTAPSSPKVDEDIGLEADEETITAPSRRNGRQLSERQRPILALHAGLCESLGKGRKGKPDVEVESQARRLPREAHQAGLVRDVCLLLRGRHGLRFSTLLPASVHRRPQ